MHESAEIPEGKILVTTKGENVVSVDKLDLSDLQPCTHAYKQGLKKVMVRATDTDVLVLAIATANVLEVCEIWLAFW